MWFDGIVPPGDGDLNQEIDPVLAYDGVADRFLLVQLNATLNSVEARTYDASLDIWGSWTPVYTSPIGLDKPWITPGEVYSGIPDQQEFYAIMQESTGGSHKLSYARSVDGGATWFGDEVRVDDEIVYGRFTFITCHDDRNVYVSFVGENDQSELGAFILEGVDDDSVPGQPAISFDYLKTEYGVPPPPPGDGGFGGDSFGIRMSRPIFIPLHRSSLQEYLPGNLWQVIHGVQIAADPTDPDVLYVVYADTESDTSNDVNIYFHVVSRQPLYPNGWALGPRTKINDDEDPPPDWEYDQMLPSIAVDSQGVIYITYYDEREHAAPGADPPRDQNDDDPIATWDMRIAWSLDGGQFWLASQEIVEPLDPGDTEPDPAYDETVPHNVVKPGEYTGLTVFEGLVGERPVREVWTAFTGISDDDGSPVGRNSVIWSNRSYWTKE